MTCTLVMLYVRGGEAAAINTACREKAFILYTCLC